MSIGGGVSSMMPGMSQNRAGPGLSKMAEELLSQADTDNNGAISESEFNALFDGNESADTESLEGLFAQMDSSGDGELGSDETSEALNNLHQQFREIGMMPPPPPPSAEELISSGDVDGDNVLDFSEFSSALQSPDGNDDSSILEAMFSEADTNGDGKVTQEELQSAMDSHRPDAPPAETSADSANSKQISRMVEALLEAYQAGTNNEENSLLSALA